MPNVDERVVQMTFDNKQFEKNVSQSLKTLDDLKKALELDKMNNSLQNLEKQTNDVSKSMSSLEATVNQVSSVFTPFGNLAYNALNRISNAALNAGANLLKMAVGINGADLQLNLPGSEKYEAYTKAMQVITNATGKSVDEIGGYLDKLMHYTDETSYDFSEMISNIGKFTAVGVDVEEAEEAMEGIANWAAKSGAGKQKANQAMYNISQAMGSGAMRLQDWRSIENANMNTKEFTETAIETAIELGVLQRKGQGVGTMLEYTSKGVKETTVDFKSFRDTLKSGWLNSEVMLETLRKYGDQSTEFGLAAYHAAQEALTFTDAIDTLKDAVSSGWMETQKHLFGNLDEAKTLWTNVATALQEFAGIFSEQRNNLLGAWHEMGGYNMAVEAASNIWSVFKNVVLGVKEALEQVFPPTTAEQLVYITERVKDFTEQLSNAFRINTTTEITTQLKDAVKNANLLGTNLHWGVFDPERVKALKKFLKYFGYLPEEYNNAAGKFGDYTEEAIKKLQRELNVTATGVWDEATRAAVIANEKFNDIEIAAEFKNVEEVVKTVSKEINHASELTENLNKGNRGEWVRKLQEQLMAAGYALDKHSADGIYGAETEAAVKQLQQALGVEVTGAWDDATRSAAIAAKVFSEFNEVEETTIEKTQGLTGPMDLLQNVVRFLAGAVKTVVEIAKGALEIGWNIFLMLTPIFELLGKIGHLISQLALDLTDSADSGQIIARIVETILTLLSPLGYAIEAVTRPFSDFLDGFQNWLNMNKGMHSQKGTFWMLIHYLEKSSVFKKNVKNFNKAFKTLKETVIGAFDKIKGIGKNIYDAIFGTTDIQKEGYTLRKKNITTFFENVVSVATWATTKLTALVGIVEKVVVGVLSFFKENIVPFIKGIKDTVINKNVKSISDFFITLWNNIKNSPIGKKLDEIREKIVGFFDRIKETIQNKFPTIYNLITNIKNKIAKVFGNIGSIFSYMFEAFNSGRINSISDFFTELKNAIMSTSIGKKLKIIVHSVMSFISEMKKIISEKGVIGAITSALQLLFKWDPNKTFFENIGDKFDWLVEKVMAVKEKIAEAMRGLFRILTGKEDDGNFTSVFDKIKEFLDKNFKNFNWKALIPGAVGGLIGFLTMTSMGKETKGIEGLVSGLMRGNLFKSVGGKLLGAAAAMVGAITLLSVIPADEIKEKINTALSFIQGKLAEFIEKIKSLFSTNPETGRISVLDKLIEGFSNLKPLLKSIIDLKDKIVGALGEIFKAVTGFDGDPNTPTVFDRIKEFVKGLKNIKIGAILGPALGIATIYGLVTSSRAFKNLSKGILQFISGNADLSVKKDTIGDTALKIAGAIAAVSLSLGLLSIIDADKAAKGIEKFIEVIAVMTGAMIAVNKLGGEGSNFGVQMLALAGSITLLAIGLKVFASVLSGINSENWGSYLGAGAIIVGLLVLLGVIETAIAAASRTTGSPKISGILQMCIGVGVIILAYGHLVDILEKHSIWTNLGAVGIIAGILVGLGVISTHLAKYSGNDGITKISGILGMCIGVGVILLAFGHIVKTLDEVGAGAIICGIAALIVIFGGMAILGSVLNNTTASLGQALQNIAQLITMAGAISLVMEAFAKSINLIKDADWSVIAAFAAGIAGIMAVLAHVMPILGQLSFKSILVGAVALVAIFTAIGLSIDIVATFTADALEKIGSALWMITDDLAKASQHIASVDWSALETFGTYLKDDLPSLLTTAMGLSDDATEAHTTMTEVSEFAAAFHNYGTQIGSITEDMVTSTGYAEQLAESALTIFNTLSSLGTIPTKPITDLGAALDIYYNQIAGIGTNKETGESIDVTNLPKVNAEMISEAFKALGKAIPDDGTIDTINSFKEGGTNDLTETALGIEKIGVALKTYGENIGTLNILKVMTANSVLNAFKGIYETFQSKSAFLALFQKLGLAEDEQTQVSQFSESIQLVGGALKDYIAATDGINDSKIRTANGVVSLIASIDRSLPERGGFSGLLFGNKDTLGHFGTNMSRLGTGIQEFADKTAEGDYTHINDALPAVQALSEILSTLDNVGGIAGWVSGEKSFSAITKGLAGDDGVAAHLSSFSDSMKNFQYSSISQAMTAIRTIIGMAQQVDELTYVSDTGHNKIEDIGIGIAGMFREIASVMKESVTIKNGNILGYGKESMNVLDAVSQIGPKLVEAISKGILPQEGGTNPIKEAIVKLIADAHVNLTGDNTYTVPYNIIGDNLVTAINTGVVRTANNVLYSTLSNIAATGPSKFTSYHQDYIYAGNDILDGVISGVIRLCHTFYEHLKNISAQGAKEIGNKYNDYVNTGVNLMQGLIVGMWRGQKAVITTATNIGNAAHKALNKATEVHSPSKLFAWTGEMWGEGLVEGINKETSSVANSIGGLGETASNTISEALSNGSLSMDNMDGFLSGLNGSLDSQLSNIMSGLENFSMDDVASKLFGTGEGTDLAINNSVQSMFNGFEEKITTIFQDDGTMSSTIQNLISNMWSNATGSLKNAVSEAGDPKEMILSTVQNAWKGITGENANFTLKPVLDFENMSIGGGTASNIVDYLKGINENNATMLAANETANQAAQVKQEILETYMGVISNKVGVLIDRMEEQTTRIDQLGADMSQMKLVLNTGTLVGEIVPKIDRELGKRSAINARAR